LLARRLSFGAIREWWLKPVSKNAGRAIDDSTVKSGGPTAKPGRAADEQKPAPTTPSKKKQKKQPQS
jgi:hypothetical protein